MRGTGGPEVYLLAITVVVCLGFLPVLALFSCMSQLSRGNHRMARFLCIAGLTGAGLQWLAFLAGTAYLHAGSPGAFLADPVKAFLALPLPLHALLAFAVVTTLGSLLVKRELEKDEERRERSENRQGPVDRNRGPE